MVENFTTRMLQQQQKQKMFLFKKFPFKTLKNLYESTQIKQNPINL